MKKKRATKMGYDSSAIHQISKQNGRRESSLRTGNSSRAEVTRMHTVTTGMTGASMTPRTLHAEQYEQRALRLQVLEGTAAVCLELYSVATLRLIHLLVSVNMIRGDHLQSSIAYTPQHLTRFFFFQAEDGIRDA